MHGFELACGCWELNSQPSEERLVLLTAEPSLQILRQICWSPEMFHPRDFYTPGGQELMVPNSSDLVVKKRWPETYVVFTVFTERRTLSSYRHRRTWDSAHPLTAFTFNIFYLFVAGHGGACLNPRTQEAEASRSLSSRPAWSTE